MSNTQQDDVKNVYELIKKSWENGKEEDVEALKEKFHYSSVNKAIRKLENEGKGCLHKKKIKKVDETNVRRLTGVIEQQGPGSFSFKSTQGVEAYLTPRFAGKVLNQDQVLAFVVKDPSGKWEALPSRVMQRDLQKQHVARYRQTHKGIMAWCLDYRAEEVMLPIDPSDAKEGDLILVQWQDQELLSDRSKVKVIKKIGNEQDKGIESSLSFMSRFTDEKIDINKIKDWDQWKDQGPREDVTDRHWVTIDGLYSKDLDDALTAWVDQDGLHHLSVAIADVSAMVEQHSELDRWAQRQMTSVYLPHRVYSMLPSELATHLCSLNPNEKRGAMCLDVVWNADQTVKDYRFYRGWIESKARLNYEQVQRVLDGQESMDNPVTQKTIETLSTIALQLKRAGTEAGRVEYDDVEVEWDLNEQGKIKNLRESKRLWAHKLVEECMLLTNQYAAQYIHEHYGQGLFRNHLGVKPEHRVSVYEGLTALGVEWEDEPEDEVLTQKKLTQALEKAQLLGKGEQARSIILSGMDSAQYQTDSQGHFSLVAQHYCHFTSPIRRYADLSMHRLMKKIMDQDVTNQMAMEELAKEVTVKSKKASQAENEAKKMLMIEYLSRQMNGPFEAQIVTMSSKGLWMNVQLEGARVEFFMGGKSLKDQGFSWKDGAGWQQGDMTWKEGEVIVVKVSSCDLNARRIEWKPDPETYDLKVERAPGFGR